VVPLADPVLGGSLRGSCRALVALIAGALSRAYGLPVALAGDVAPDPEAAAAAGGPAFALREACFARAFGYELVLDGRKLMGSAQRRTPHALLQQGSLLVGPGHERLARYGAAGPDPRAETALARGAITLHEALGARPDPAPFREALREAWQALRAQGSGQAGTGSLDSPAGPS
jgi:hypothetical protein